MKLKTLKAFLFLAFIFTINGCAEVKKGNGNKKDEGVASNHNKIDEPSIAMTMLLPINATEKPKISLAVEIPSNFRSHLPLEEQIKSPMNEFFLKTDKNIDNWSEIITTQTYVARRITAKEIVDFVKNNIEKNAREIKLIGTKENSFENYSTSEFTMAYTHQGMREVIFAKYFSGPYDCSGLQYTIRLLNNLSESDALKKINEFAKCHVHLIKEN